MIRDFEEIYKLTDMISSDTAFNREESVAFYWALASLEPGSTILEVGCEFGRSTSILAQIAKAEHHRLVLIEPVPRPELLAMLTTVEVPFTLHAMRTEAVVINDLPLDVDFLHIDGDHSKQAIEIDCMRLLPLLVGGGFACFHDYGRESLPEVKPAVDVACDAARFQALGTYGTLHIVERVR